MHRKTVTAGIVVSAAVAAAFRVFWPAADSPAEPRSSLESATLPVGPPLKVFRREPLGDAPNAQDRPQIANVHIVDLDRDGLADVLVCDAVKGRVSWIRQSSTGTYVETPLGDPIPAPAHAQAVDLDADGDLDVVVGSLGVLLPNNQRIGSVVVLENDGRQRFTNRAIIGQIARVAYVGVGDLDGDRDLDLAVAGFGYDRGETLWLERTGTWQFVPHVLQRLSGPINAIVADVDRDEDLDIVTLVSQEWEDIWLFENNGRGEFDPRILWGSSNADFGSSWITLADLDRDEDLDIVYSNGDALDYAPTDSRPWHGVQWLENTGAARFEMHRLADLSGASSPQPADVDGDGDLDVVVVSAYNKWDDPAALSLVVLENDGKMQFRLRPVASSPTHLVTVAVGDLNGDARPDLVTGGLHLTRPFDRMSRVTLWSNGGSTARD
jgi:FG-GAP-like repeat